MEYERLVSFIKTVKRRHETMNRKKIREIFEDWASEQHAYIDKEDRLNFMMIDGYVDVEDFVSMIEDNISDRGIDKDELIKKVTEFRDHVRKESGSFKYDFIYNEILKIIKGNNKNGGNRND